jgi:hypothetical protein
VSREPASEFWILDFRFWIADRQSRISDFEFLISKLPLASDVSPPTSDLRPLVAARLIIHTATKPKMTASILENAQGETAP